MAAILPTTLGDIGRVGILKIFRQEADNYDDLSEIIVGNRFETRQTFEIFKSLIGLGTPKQYAPGDTILADSLANQFSTSFYPQKVATAVEFAYETAFVDRYNQIASLQSQIAEQFVLKRNIIASNLDSTGFTTTTNGMNNEALYSTSHSNNGYAGSNRPAIDIPLGPMAVMQAESEMAQQVSTRGNVMPYSGPILIKVPIALRGTAYALSESEKIPGTNANDKNYAGKTRFKFRVIDFYTSQQAWFARYEDNKRHGLFILDQMPYDIIPLPIDRAMLYTYIAFESYCVGWAKWYGTWGTLGA